MTLLARSFHIFDANLISFWPFWKHLTWPSCLNELKLIEFMSQWLHSNHKTPEVIHLYLKFRLLNLLCYFTIHVASDDDITENVQTVSNSWTLGAVWRQRLVYYKCSQKYNKPRKMLWGSYYCMQKIHQVDSFWPGNLSFNQTVSCVSHQFPWVT